MAKNKPKKNAERALGNGLLGKTPGALKRTGNKQLLRQAQHLMKALYAPALHDIRTEMKSVKSIDAKRASDNKYYLDWLTSQTGQLQAHQDAAAASLGQGPSSGSSNLGAEVLAGFAQQPGTVSNTDYSTAVSGADAAGAAGDARVENASTRTSQTASLGNDMLDLANASNFALIQAADIRRQGETFARLSELGDAKTKTKLERAASSAQEVARLLDKEVEKARAQLEMRNLAAQLALGLKEHNLNVRKFGFSKRSTIKGLNEDERHNRATEEETAEHNDATEEHADAQLALDEWEAKHDKDTDPGSAKIGGQKAALAINEAVQWAKTHGLKATASDDPQKAVQKLQDKAQYSPIVAKAAIEILTEKEVSKKTYQAFLDGGIRLPRHYLR